MQEQFLEDESVILNSESKIKRDLIKVLSTESQAITNLINNFPESSITLIKKIIKTEGRVIFSGMGKSGLIAKKLVATFSSTGTPSLFLHPAEALHGDLGMIRSDDLFIAISKSGTGKELAQIIPILKSCGNYTTLICCSKGKLSDIVDLTLELPFTQEACQMNLAPTTSSTLCMAFGDAIGVVVSKLKNFDKNDFAKFHPAGALGKRLLLKVNSLMVCEPNLPFLNLNTSFVDLLYVISSNKLGVGIIVDDDKKLLGIITDGDLRRSAQKGPEIFNKKASDIMTKNPKSIKQDILAYDALNIMQSFNITSLVVKNSKEEVVGLIHIHDLLKAGF
ncbi:KpsF/GutQ family sugar-phosphate isomerase [Candidatus Dependentiae bacterium]|nr:KpsF/GutQ family sugar-phosphate isomerase [Candidatus Dependentiae bacterium]